MIGVLRGVSRRIGELALWSKNRLENREARGLNLSFKARSGLFLPGIEAHKLLTGGPNKRYWVGAKGVCQKECMCFFLKRGASQFQPYYENGLLLGD